MRTRYTHSGSIPTYWLVSLLAGLILASTIVGHGHAVRRATEMQEQQQEETARRVLDTMSLQWGLRDQVFLHASRLASRIEDLSAARKNRKISWPSLSTEVCNRFSGARVWIFAYSTPAMLSATAGTTTTTTLATMNTANVPDIPDALPELVAAPGSFRAGRRVMRQAFHLLVKNHLGVAISDDERIKIGKIIQALFGEEMDPVSLAQDLCATPIKVVTERVQHYLVWDVIMSNNRPVAGFFLLIPDTVAAADAAMRAAAETAGSENINRNGFLRVHKSAIGDIFPEPLLADPIFTRWCNNYRAMLFSERERSAAPWAEKIGKFRIFTRILLNSTHLAVVLLPIVPKPQIPVGMQLIGLACVAGGILLLIRGTLLGIWPTIPLAWRFIGLYALASAFPLVLAVHTFSGYVEERRHALLQGLERKLTAAIVTADLCKGELRSRYLATFLRLVDDTDWCRKIVQNGLLNQDITTEIFQQFSDASPSLPLSAILLCDRYGREIATHSPALTKEQFAGMHKFYRAAFISTLRERHQITHNKLSTSNSQAASQTTETSEPQDLFKEEDELLIKAFHQLSSTDVTQRMEARRKFPEYVKSGNQWLYKLHEFITTAANEAVALAVIWHDSFLDKHAVLSAMTDFNQVLPDGIFLAFRRDRARPIPLTTATARQLRIFNEPVKMAINRGSTFSDSVQAEEQWFVLAAPSQTMQDVWLAAALPVQAEFSSFEARRRHLFGFLLLSFAVVTVLGIATARNVVPSILSVKEGLVSVTAGNLDVSVKLDRPDELGALTQAFDAMTAGLQQRQRLSTFVSGVALQVMNTGETLKPRRSPGLILVSDIRSFTTLCEDQPAPVITAMLNHHFDLMSAVIHDHGGRIDRFIGDAIQAVFEPQPDAPDNLAERAVSAGLAMLRQLQTINAERQAAEVFVYAIGIGLSYGELLFGGIGDPALRFEISVLGEAVAEATWLESLSKNAPGLPLVMTPEIAKSAGTLTKETIPLCGHEDCAFVFPATTTVTDLLIGSLSCNRETAT